MTQKIQIKIFGDHDNIFIAFQKLDLVIEK